MALAILLSLPLLALCDSWQTVYSANFSTAYLQSTNGSLYKLPISETNLTTSDINQSLRKISSAPTNSSLVVDSDGHLMAIWGSGSCGTSPIEISQYNSQKDEWASLAQSNAKTQNWAQSGQVVWIDRNADTIYIYGGHCGNQTQKSLYSFNLNNSTFTEVVDESVQPHSMSNAATLALSDYETLVLGGRADSAWISMQQIALFSYGSWNFESVSNSSGIDSRENALLLPIFSDGQNGTAAINDIVVIGGEVAGYAAQPQVCMLRRSDSSGWYWDTESVAASSSQSISKRSSTSSSSSNEGSLNVTYAGSTIYSTLANLDEESNQIELYGSTNSSSSGWQPVEQVSVNKLTTTDKHTGGTSTAVIAVVSTLLPVIFLCLVGVGIWWWWRRRREQRLLLRPNRISMLQRQQSSRSTAASTWSQNAYWTPHRSMADLPPLPRGESDDEGSVHIVNGNNLVMSQRRSLHVVNPDGHSETPTPVLYQNSGSFESVASVDTFDSGVMKEKSEPERRSSTDTTGSRRGNIVSRRSSRSSNSIGSDPFSDKAAKNVDLDFDFDL